MVEVKRSAELEEQMRESVKAFRDGDEQWFADHTAEGGEIVIYGTAPGEEWRGRDAVLSLTSGEGQRMNDDVGITESEPEFECYEAGDTGWVVTHGHFELADGASVPVRSVAVMVRDEDRWKRVFAAVHVVASNELLKPGSPLAVRQT